MKINYKSVPLFIDLIEDALLSHVPKKIFHFNHFYDIDNHLDEFIEKISNVDCYYRKSSSGGYHVVSNEICRTFGYDHKFTENRFFNNKGIKWADLIWYNPVINDYIIFESIPSIVIKEDGINIYHTNTNYIEPHIQYTYFFTDIIYITDVREERSSSRSLVNQSMGLDTKTGIEIYNLFKKWKKSI